MISEERRAAIRAKAPTYLATENAILALDALEAAEAEIHDRAQETADLRAQIAELRKNGVPGVMHEVDKAFYDLTVKERNLERARVDRLSAENADLRAQIAQLQHERAHPNGEG